MPTDQQILDLAIQTGLAVDYFKTGDLIPLNSSGPKGLLAFAHAVLKADKEERQQQQTHTGD